MEGREVWIYGAIQLQSHFVSFQSLPYLAIWQPLNLLHCRVGNVCMLLFFSHHPNELDWNWGQQARRYLGSMPLLKTMLHSTKKKVSGSSGWRCITREHCMVGLLISTRVQCARVSDCILMDLCCRSVYAIAETQMSSRHFWYILLHLLHWSKKSLCEVAQLLTPSQRGQPWHSATGETFSAPAAWRMQSRAEQDTAAKVWRVCILRRGRKGYSPGLSNFPA